MPAFAWFLLYLLGYLAVGALYARSQALAISKRIRADILVYRPERAERREVGRRVVGWPVMAVVDFVRGPAFRWTTAPVTSREERIAELRKDAAHWRAKLDEGTAAEREMAAVLVRSLTEQADELRRALGHRY